MGMWSKLQDECLLMVSQTCIVKTISFGRFLVRYIFKSLN